MGSVSDIAGQVDRAFWLIGGICIVLLAAITATMIGFVVKYHRSRARTTRQIKVYLPLEIAWTVLPTALVIFMFFVGYKGFRQMRDPPLGARVVQVIGQQWVWSFVYPEEGITSDRLFLPVGEAAKFDIGSKDVVHSFYLPAFRVKEDAVPGKETHLWIEPKRTGRFNIFCAEFCGKDHSRMLSELVVLPRDDFDAWMKERIAEKNKPIVIEEVMNPLSDEIRRRDGERLFLTYCSACHGREGQGGLVKGARNFKRLDGWFRSPRITDIFRTLTEGIPGTEMRPFKQITPWDRFALAHRVASFYAGGDRPRATREEFARLVKEYGLDRPPAPEQRLTIEQAMDIVAREAGAGGEARRPAEGRNP